MKVFDILSEFNQIQELIETEEFDEKTGELIDNSKEIQELLNEITLEKEVKCDSIAYLIQESKSSQLALKEEITRLNERSKAFKRKQDKLTDLLKFLLHGEKFETLKHTFSYRRSTSVKILDESLIPAKYLNVKETVTVDKKAIGAALKDFEIVKGAELETKQNLQIK